MGRPVPVRVRPSAPAFRMGQQHFAISAMKPLISAVLREGGFYVFRKIADLCSHFCVTTKRPRSSLRERQRNLAVERPRFGIPGLSILMRRGFGIINHKRVERLYKEEGLRLSRLRRRKRRGMGLKACLCAPKEPKQRCSMDFMSDDSVTEGVFAPLILSMVSAGNVWVSRWTPAYNEHWFLGLDHARSIIDTVRREYNEERPNSSSGYLTSSAFRKAFEEQEQQVVA